MRADRRAMAGVALAAALALGCGLRLFLHMEPRQLGPTAWAYLGGGGNSLVVVHGTEAFAADVKLGDWAMRERRMVQEELRRNVKRILVTSSHLDHWEGVTLYPDAGALLAHPRTRDRITGWLRQRRLPGIHGWLAVRSEVRLMLGEQEAWIRWLGVGNTDGDLTAFIPELDLVVTGDLFCQGYEPAADASAGGRLLGLRRALDAMLEYDFESVLPGHGPMARRADVAAARDYLAAMESALREAVGRGLAEEAAVEAGEAALRAFPRLEPLPAGPDRRENLRAMYRELTQADKSAAP